MSLPWSLRLAALTAPLLVALQARADEPEEPTFEHYVVPLRVEAGPVISPPVGAVPRTELWGAAGFLYGKQEDGLTTYHLLGTRLVVGGEWSPRKIERLGIGAALVALQTTHYHTDLPPAIDEWRNFFDLGPLRVHARFQALRFKERFAELALTPFFRLVFPTDTSRIREFRDMPIRHVLDDRVFTAPYFLVEPGLSLGVTLGPVSLTMHQAPVFAAIHEEAFQFFWSMHYGVGVDILGVVDLSVEIAGLLRPTRAHQEHPDRDRWVHDNHVRLVGPFLEAFAVCPGVRLKRSRFTYEISARIGITPDAYNAYGDFTIAFAMTWLPGRK